MWFAHPTTNCIIKPEKYFLYEEDNKSLEIYILFSTWQSGAEQTQLKAIEHEIKFEC